MDMSNRWKYRDFPTSNMSGKTYDKIHENGKRVLEGDQETGIWIASQTLWYEVEGGLHVYMREGSRVKATWEFRRGRWEVCSMDLGSILPPESRPTRWAKLRFAYVGVVVLATIVLAVIGLWPR